MNYKILFTLGILFLPLSAFAASKTVSDAAYQEMLQLDYKAFDQTLPDGGWRGIADHVEAGKVIDAYHLQNLEKLQSYQDRILYWHAGQVYAMAGLNTLGLSRFKKSFNPDEKPDDKFKWNSYVRGSIAFLEGDLTALKAARNEMKDAEEAKINLKILEAFIRCFGKPYRQAYNPECK